MGGGGLSKNGFSFLTGNKFRVSIGSVVSLNAWIIECEIIHQIKYCVFQLILISK